MSIRLQILNLGIALRYTQSRNSLLMFGIGLHHHWEGDGSPCPFRSGIEITLFNFDIALGIWA